MKDRYRGFLIGNGVGHGSIDPRPVRMDKFAPIRGSDPKPLLEVTGCMWPVGEAPALFCDLPRLAKPAKAGGATVYFSYCARHQEMACAKRQES